MIFLQAIASLALRCALALPFYQSGLTKWDGPFQLAGSTVFLFENVYRPTVFGTTYDMPFPVLAAWGASFAEVLLPIALVLGFATRLSALGILIMTAVIYTMYPALGVAPGQWQTETLPWGAMAAALIAYGAGWLSFDKLIRSSWQKR